MPLIDLAFSLKPVGHIASVPLIPVLPKFMRSLRDLFFQAHVLIDFENGDNGFVDSRLC